jgi:hypothetical protein
MDSEKSSRPFNMLRKQSMLTADDKGYQVFKTTTVSNDNDDENVNDETTEKERTFSNVQETTLPDGEHEQVSNYFVS